MFEKKSFDYSLIIYTQFNFNFLQSISMLKFLDVYPTNLHMTSSHSQGNLVPRVSTFRFSLALGGGKKRYPENEFVPQPSSPPKNGR